MKIILGDVIHLEKNSDFRGFMGILETTPFGKTGNYTYVPKKQNGKIFRDCSVEMIKSLNEKNIINNYDLNILEKLCYYRVLNMEILYSLLSDTFSIQDTKKKNQNKILKSINKLRRFGIIGCYVNDEQNIYIPSEGGLLYHYLSKNIKRSRFSGELKEYLDAAYVNKIVSVNTFYVFSFLPNINKLRIKYDYYRFFQYKNKHNKFNFGVVSLRRSDLYLSYILECSYKAENYFSNYYIILICEDNKHLKEVIFFLEQKKFLKSNILFTTDRDCLINGFEGIYKKNTNGYLSSINFI